MGAHLLNMTTPKHSEQDQQLLAAVKAIHKENYIIHTYKNTKGKCQVRISPNEGRDNDTNYNFLSTTTAFIARWVDLDKHGTLGKKFAKLPHQARFSLDVVAGGLQNFNKDNADSAETIQMQYIQRLEDIQHEFATHVFEDPRLCLRKKQQCLTNAKETLATLKQVPIASFNDDNADVLQLQKQSFLASCNNIVCRNSHGTSFKMKTRVFKTNWDDPASDDILSPVPIFDIQQERSSVALNADSNDTVYIRKGDLLFATFRFKPYILDSGVFGISLDLCQVTRIKQGPGQVGEKRQRHLISFSSFAS